ncbi:epidermal patterning factor 1 [Tasmannia lanceolata]|uniref:epidermal patterning factor 1 n=1 Tax=Tasmannia lanceolata TaxID=3420 RepID=UPI004063E7E9
MKIYTLAALLLTILLLHPLVVPGRHIGRSHPHHNHHHQTRTISLEITMVKPDLYQERRQVRLRRADTVQIAGSRLPDCSHACGSCSPCRLVMVSFVCALEEAETCPMAYKCMCNSKSYPVP